MASPNRNQHPENPENQPVPRQEEEENVPQRGGENVGVTTPTRPLSERQPGGSPAERISPPTATTPGRRARRLEMESGAGSSSMEVQLQGAGSAPPIQRRRVELVEIPQSEPACSICQKKFASWKAVFGHMRAHPEREWRGAFPPPRGADWSPMQVQAQSQEFGQTLLNLAVETLERMQGGGTSATMAAATGRSAADMEVEAPAAGERAGAGGRGLGIDLNRSPPNSEESGDSDKKNDSG